MLSDKEQIRYSRQMLVKGFSEEQQLMLKNATVLIVGCGGLGNPASLYLASSGIGRLIIADGDHVELSNLQRQVVFTEQSINQSKAEVMAAHLTSLNSDIDVEAVDDMVDAEFLDYYLPMVDVVLDCTDNLNTRYLLNDYCIAHSTVLISGAAIRAEGQVMMVNPNLDNFSCYQCFYPKSKGEPSLNCSTAGVIAPVLGIIGSMQALLAIKHLTAKRTLDNKVMIFDGMTMQWQRFNITKKQNCVCSNNN
ncbi:HesA/MoeB/ThiF family protein [Thalassotalea crassostreae]|uniref:HesA/MoeB/ThiF family protein n=1 Tax=Thalassotalea crassostreae TaxID=1763536 RepID=UPI0008392381|nr:HesA/MoeB/ThiF family protein [Thalassotalea crassostreae]